MLFFVYLFRLISSSHFLVIKNEDAVLRAGSSEWLVRGGDCSWGLEDVVVRGEGSVGMMRVVGRGGVLE